MSDLALRLDVRIEFARQWEETGQFSTVRAASALGVSYVTLYRVLRQLRQGGYVELDGARWVPGLRSGRGAA